MDRDIQKYVLHLEHRVICEFANATHHSARWLSWTLYVIKLFRAA